MPDYRSLPSVDKLMKEPRLAGFSERVRGIAARQAVTHAREQAASGGTIDSANVAGHAAQIAEQLARPSLAPAINMSGVLLHTGLGRARLSKEAADQIAVAARGHATVEYDRATGKRGDRQEHVSALLKELTGAEGALVVNNCAAAVFLSLNALCAGKEVILSRGQMVEIGGSFRLHDIVRQSGCRLVEVGSTNKTRVSDYSQAITAETAAILRCHPSNFKIVGFHEEPSAQDLSALCKEHDLIHIDDVGSGCLVDTTKYGLPRERTLREAVADGPDVVTASGDKLLGGTQAGLVLGSKVAIDRIARHPLARAVRVDKLTLAGLEATLSLYAEGREDQIPVWRYLSKEPKEVKADAEKLAKAWPHESTVEEGATEVGGGSMPGATVPTWRVGLRGENPESVAERLRNMDVPIVGYIEDGTFWLDPRTAEKDEVETVAAALRGV